MSTRFDLRRAVKVTFYDPDSHVTEWSETEYDSKGNRVSFTRYSADGAVLNRNEYEYDDNGNIIKEIIVIYMGAHQYEKNLHNK